MKKTILILSLLLGFNASAGTGDVGSADGPGFSAFVLGNVLYATVMGDSCNQFRGEIKVANQCRADRLMRNYAEECNADLAVGGTEMACQDQSLTPRVVKIDLKKSGVTNEAKVLFLTYGGRTIEVQIVK